MLEQNLAFVLIGIGAIFLIGIMVMVARFYRKVDQGRALIVNKMREEPDVTFTGGVVLPIIHRAEVMDISLNEVKVLLHRGRKLLARALARTSVGRDLAGRNFDVEGDGRLPGGDL